MPGLHLFLAALPARSLACRGFGLGAGLLALPARRPRAGSLPHPPAGLCPLVWGQLPYFRRTGQAAGCSDPPPPRPASRAPPPGQLFPPVAIVSFFGRPSSALALLVLLLDRRPKKRFYALTGERVPIPFQGHRCHADAAHRAPMR